MAVFNFIDGKLVLSEIAEGTTLEDIKKNTECDYEVASDLKTFWNWNKLLYIFVYLNYINLK